MITKTIFAKIYEVAEAKYEEGAWDSPHKSLTDYLWDELEVQLEKEIERRSQNRVNTLERENSSLIETVQRINAHLNAKVSDDYCHCEIPREVCDSSGQHCGNCGKMIGKPFQFDVSTITTGKSSGSE